MGRRGLEANAAVIKKENTLDRSVIYCRAAQTTMLRQPFGQKSCMHLMTQKFHILRPFTIQDNISYTNQFAEKNVNFWLLFKKYVATHFRLQSFWIIFSKSASLLFPLIWGVSRRFVQPRTNNWSILSVWWILWDHIPSIKWALCCLTSMQEQMCSLQLLCFSFVKSAFRVERWSAVYQSGCTDRTAFAPPGPELGLIAN